MCMDVSEKPARPPLLHVSAFCGPSRVGLSMFIGVFLLHSTQWDLEAWTLAILAPLSRAAGRGGVAPRSFYLEH